MLLPMKKVFVLLFMLLSTAICFAQATPEQEVQDAEYAWLRAYEQNDTLAMDQYVADGFLIRYPSGKVDTKENLMQMLRTQASTPSTLKLSTEQTTAHVWGNTVILRGIVISEFEIAGKTQQERQYYTDTWLKTDKGWQVIASHLSDVAKPVAAKKNNQNTTKRKRAE